MRSVKLSAFLFLFAFLAAAPLWGDTLLNIYTQNVDRTVTSGTMPLPYGYFPNSDTTLTDSTDIASPAGSHAGHQDSYYFHERTYEDPTRVNGSTILSTNAFVPTAITLEPGHGYAMASGHADASRLRLGIGGAAASLGPPGAGSLTAESYSYAELSNSFTVLPGTSGLAEGTEVTLAWDFNFVGHMSLAAISYPADGGAYGSMRANADIQRGIEVCNEGEGEGSGCYHPGAAGFGVSVQSEAYDVNHQYWPEVASAYTDQYWRASSNTGLNESDSEAPWHDYSPGELGPGAQFNWGSSTNVDTDNFSPGGITFVATVGETLLVSADMYQYLSAYGTAGIDSDFFHTFEFDVLPVTEGIQLSWAIPREGGNNNGGSEVPEPATLLLLASGLGTGALARRRAKAK